MPVSAEEVTRTARRFRQQLQNRVTRDYRPTAQTLHTWLVAPYEAALEDQELDTLVFAPATVTMFAKSFADIATLGVFFLSWRAYP